jgi:hypothetical protein
MRLDVRGHPLHTRALSVTLVTRADAKLDVYAYVLDLRKRGFVPVAGDLQSSGIIHHMQLAGVVDPSSATLESITAAQPTVAFEPSAATDGESCRDPIGRIAALAGARLDSSWAKRLGGEIGGPRGCSHILTLAQLLGSAVAWALERERELHGTIPARRAGERVFRRDVIVDGHEPADGRIDLAAQLIDLHFAPAAARAAPMDRFAAELEMRALAEVELATMTLTPVAVAERRRDLDTLEQAAWRERADFVAGLGGLRLASGIAAELLRRLGAAKADRPLLDGMLMLAPSFIQCVAAVSDPWAVAAKQQRWFVGLGGQPDSCYMWRAGGALDRGRKSEGR